MLPLRRATGGALLAASIVAASACSKSDPPVPAGSAAASAQAVASASSSAAAGDADPEVSAALERLAQCDTHQPSRPKVGADGKLDRRSLDGIFCPHDVAWSDLLSKLRDERDLARTRDPRIVSACAARFGHASLWVRRAAYACVAEHSDGVADPRATLTGAFEALAKEASPDVQRAIWMLVDALDPTELGQAARAVELARAHSGDDQVLESVLEALAPSSDYTPTSPEAVGFAVELAKAGRGGSPVVALVLASAMSPAEACEVFVGMLASKGKAWASGLEGMAETEGRCQASVPGAVSAIALRAEQAKASPEAWERPANFAMRDHLGDLPLDPASKAKLREALGTLSKEQREGYGTDVIADVLEKLK